jgi:hypothetical protein
MVREVMPGRESIKEGKDEITCIYFTAIESLLSISN